jgi:hypothetical protein
VLSESGERKKNRSSRTLPKIFQDAIEIVRGFVTNICGLTPCVSSRIMKTIRDKKLYFRTESALTGQLRQALIRRHAAIL